MPHDRQRAYDRAREAFDDLNAEEQARFLMETTVSAAARGARGVSRVLSDELEHVFHGPSGNARREENAQRDEPDARAPRASHEDASGTRRRGARRRGTRRRGTPRRGTRRRGTRRRGAPGPAEAPTDAQRGPA